MLLALLHYDALVITCFCLSDTASDIAKTLVAPWTCWGAACRPRPGSSSFSLASIVGLAMHSAASAAASISDLVCVCKSLDCEVFLVDM